jgi:hypothetical protein
VEASLAFHMGELALLKEEAPSTIEEWERIHLAVDSPQTLS